MSFQAYLDNIEEKTGKTPAELIELARQQGFTDPKTKASVILEWLKTDFDLGRGHGMALVQVIKHGPQISDKHVGTGTSHSDPSDLLHLDGKKDRSDSPGKGAKKVSDVDAFNAAVGPTRRAICEALQAQFDQHLGSGTSRLYHGSPVWFVEGNPLVGYSLKKAGVAVLFWSGQSFKEPGLTSIGKYKAAEFTVRDGEGIPRDKLDRWLAESRTIVWDYKNIARGKGTLELLHGKI
jgi:hypothetical protein